MPPEDRVAQLVERRPRHGHVPFLAVPFVRRPVGEPGSPDEVDPDRFVTKARGGEEVDQHRPAVCEVTGLLPQLPPSCLERVLPRRIEQPRGQLPQRRLGWVPILMHHENLVGLI